MHEIPLDSPSHWEERSASAGGGMGAESKRKAGLADAIEGKPPRRHLYGRLCTCRKQFDVGDARGEAPCIK